MRLPTLISLHSHPRECLALASPSVSVLRGLGVSERVGGHGETEGYAAEPRGQWWRGGQGRAKRRCRPGKENLGRTAKQSIKGPPPHGSGGIQYIGILLPQTVRLKIFLAEFF